MESFKVRRVRNGIRAIDIAALVGVSPQAVEYYERACHKYREATREKYEGALDTLIAQRKEQS